MPRPGQVSTIHATPYALDNNAVPPVLFLLSSQLPPEGAHLGAEVAKLCLFGAEMNQDVKILQLP